MGFDQREGHSGSNESEGEFLSRYVIGSVTETGEGYGDISVSTPEHIGIVIELKYANDKDLKAACTEALKQIEEKKYAVGLQCQVITPAKVLDSKDSFRLVLLLEVEPSKLSNDGIYGEIPSAGGHHILSIPIRGDFSYMVNNPYITYHIVMTLVGYLYFQIHKNLDEGKAYVEKSLPVVVKNNKETRPKSVIIYVGQYFSIFPFLEFLQLYVECTLEVRQLLDPILAKV